MALELYLFRHVESGRNINEGTKKAIIGGRSPETPITQRGEKQAISLAQELEKREIEFDQVYCTPTVRTRETANRVLDTLNQNVNVVESPYLHEVSNGDWEGMSKPEVYVPETLEKINANNWLFCPPRGESQKDVYKRMYGFLEENFLNKSLDEDLTVGLFTHGTSIKCLLSGIRTYQVHGISEDVDLKNTIRFSINNASINRVRYVPEGNHPGWHIRTTNDSGHLFLNKGGPGFKEEKYA